MKSYSSSKATYFISKPVGLVLIFIVLLGGLGLWMNRSTQISSSSVTDGHPQLNIGVNNHDWGEIDIQAGPVTHSFNIQNTGSNVLRLYDIKTSCMCTTAQLKTKAKSSKKFGMHEKVPGLFEIKPGETAQLVVEFDPAFHGPDAVGPITRAVYLKTNDPNNPEITFYLKGNVVKINNKT